MLAHNTHHFNHFCQQSPPQLPQKIHLLQTIHAHLLQPPHSLCSCHVREFTSYEHRRGAAKGNDSNLDKYVNSQTFAPPGAHPLRNGKTPTKTQATAERKAKKEAKGKEAEGKKSVAAAHRADAKNKKQERLITAAKTKAQKAVAKANELRKKLDDAKKVIEKKSPASLTGGAQSNKKIKCAAGKSTPTSTTAIASFVESPQRKAFSAKKWVNTHSPYRYHSPALLTGGLSKSSSVSASDGRGGV